ncbi:hypothetical protein ABZ863_18720 [Saccharomonospora sp. NPDC046836]|uniref:hypothetical protein n=1 Tax=Saccharomonospora sp. NPDC046836 TaxID=3156921 RepID=UPI0033C968BD
MATVDCTPISIVQRDRTVVITMSISPAPPPSGWRYVAAFVRGRLSPDTNVLDLSGPDSLTSVSGLGKPSFSWFVGGFDGPPLPNAPLVVEAVVPAGVETREASLTVRADFSLARERTLLVRGRRLEHGRAGEPWTFTLTLPAAARPSATTSPMTEVRLCVATDIERYSRFLNPEAARAQERFVALLRAARAHAGIDESAVVVEPAGDGQYAVLPSCLDETVVIPRLLEGFAIALREANDNVSDRHRLRIRIAIDRGIVTPGANGHIGTSTIVVHRLLDSPGLRQALAARVHHDHALIVSDTVYQDVVRHEYGSLAAAEFHETVVNLPAKNFTARAWLHLPV